MVGIFYRSKSLRFRSGVKPRMGNDAMLNVIQGTIHIFLDSRLFGFSKR